MLQQFSIKTINPQKRYLSVRGFKGNLINRSVECLLRRADMQIAARPPTDTTIYRSQHIDHSNAIFLVVNSHLKSDKWLEDTNECESQSEMVFIVF